MSDLETRLSEALTQGSQAAPSALGLADAARSRARRRRRSHVVGAAAVVALCIGVPVAVVATRGSDQAESPAPSRVATDPDANAQGVPDGYRVESWHSVSILVPDSWAYGGLDSWCAGGGSVDTPRVSRPGGVNEAIACQPTTGYGLAFQQIDNTDDFEWPVVEQLGPDVPDPAFEGARGIGGVLADVTAPTRAEALDILATMRAIGPEGDLNGCPTTPTEVVRPVADGMSVCRYDNSRELEQSELLRGDDVRSAEEALRAAPAVGDMSCSAYRGPYPGEIRLLSATEDARIQLSCWRRFSSDDGDRKLTPEVLYWALSPGWSGSVPDGVSLPSDLRSP